MTSSFPSPSATFKALGIALDPELPRFLLAALATAQPLVIHADSAAASAAFLRTIGDALASGGVAIVNAASSGPEDVLDPGPLLATRADRMAEGADAEAIRPRVMVLEDIAEASVERQRAWADFLAGAGLSTRGGAPRWVLVSVPVEALARSTPVIGDLAERFVAAVLLEGGADLDSGADGLTWPAGAGEPTPEPPDLAAHLAAIRDGAAVIRTYDVLHQRLARTARAVVDSYHRSNDSALKPDARRAEALTELLVHLYATVALECMPAHVSKAFEESLSVAIALGVQMIGALAGRTGDGEVDALRNACLAAQRAYDPDAASWVDDGLISALEAAPAPPRVAAAEAERLRQERLEAVILEDGDGGRLPVDVVVACIRGRMSANLPHSPTMVPARPRVPSETRVTLYGLDRSVEPQQRVPVSVSLGEVLERSLVSIPRAPSSSSARCVQVEASGQRVEVHEALNHGATLVKTTMVTVSCGDALFQVPSGKRLHVARSGDIFTRISVRGEVRVLSARDSLSEWDGAVVLPEGRHAVGVSPLEPVALVLPWDAPSARDVLTEASAILESPAHVIPTALAGVAPEALEELPTVASRDLHTWLLTRCTDDVYHPLARPGPARHAQPVVVFGHPSHDWELLGWLFETTDPDDAWLR